MILWSCIISACVSHYLPIYYLWLFFEYVIVYVGVYACMDVPVCNNATNYKYYKLLQFVKKGHICVQAWGTQSLYHTIATACICINGAAKQSIESKEYRSTLFDYDSRTVW